jgi:Replication initiation factor
MNLTDFSVTAKGHFSAGSDIAGGGPSSPASAVPGAAHSYELDPIVLPTSVDHVSVPGSLTPLSNTGLNSHLAADIIIGIDYLTVVLPIPDAGFVFDELESIARRYTDAIEYHWSQGRFIGRQFGNWAQSPNGILAVWNLPGENGDPGSMRISLSGKVLIRAEINTTVRFISQCLNWGGKINRIDLKADDYSRSMMPDDIIQACKDRNYSGFRQSTDQGEHSGDVYTRGWTIYLGSRQSEVFARYYNAKPVHGIDAFRFEVEYKDENANAIAKMIDSMIASDNARYNSDSKAAQRVDDFLREAIPKLIIGHYKFIDRSGGARSSRCDFLPFWDAFVQRMGGSGIRLALPKIESTVQKSIAWVERSVVATLAMICKYTGGDKLAYLRYLVQIGEEKMSARHETIIKVSSREPDREYPTDEGWVWVSNF